MLGSAGHLYVPGAGLTGPGLACKPRGCFLSQLALLPGCIWPLRASPQISSGTSPHRVGAALQVVWGPHVAWKGSQGCSPTIRQVFHVAYVLIKFANSPRPDLWVLERSTDFGHTYQPWQYFACESPGMRGWQGGIPWVGGLPVLCSQGLWIPGLPSRPASRWAGLWGAYS